MPTASSVRFIRIYVSHSRRELMTSEPMAGAAAMLASSGVCPAMFQTTHSPMDVAASRPSATLRFTNCWKSAMAGAA